MSSQPAATTAATPNPSLKMGLKTWFRTLRRQRHKRSGSNSTEKSKAPISMSSTSKSPVQHFPADPLTPSAPIPWRAPPKPLQGPTDHPFFRSSLIASCSSSSAPSLDSYLSSSPERFDSVHSPPTTASTTPAEPDAIPPFPLPSLWPEGKEETEEWAGPAELGDEYRRTYARRMERGSGMSGVTVRGEIRRYGGRRRHVRAVDNWAS